MPPKKAEKKRVNKRKTRTEDVFSASPSSSSDSESIASEREQQPPKPVKKARQQDPEETALNTDDEAPVFAPKRSKQDTDKVFEDFYLRQATREFANDLDKLRSAGDFNAKSVPLLIAALKQGTGCFSAEERKDVVEALEG